MPMASDWHTSPNDLVADAYQIKSDMSARLYMEGHLDESFTTKMHFAGNIELSLSDDCDTSACL